MEQILHKRSGQSTYRLANIDWAFPIFWTIYFGVIYGAVVYVTG